MDPLNLDEIPEPQFQVRFREKIRTYDPYKIAGTLDRVKSSVLDLDVQADLIRDTLGFPKAAEATEANPTPTVNQCFAVLNGFFEFFKELPELKKLLDLTRNLPGSTT